MTSVISVTRVTMLHRREGYYMSTAQAARCAAIFKYVYDAKDTLEVKVVKLYLRGFAVRSYLRPHLASALEKLLAWYGLDDTVEQFDSDVRPFGHERQLNDSAWVFHEAFHLVNTELGRSHVFVSKQLVNENERLAPQKTRGPANLEFQHGI